MARIAIHPGEHLAEQLEELSLSAAELGRQLGVPTNRITAIINGQRVVTGDTALRLGHYFGVSPEFWLNLQANYDLRVAEAKIGKQLKSMPRLASSGRRKASSPRRALGSPRVQEEVHAGEPAHRSRKSIWSRTG
jgi:antitoxin HigA-1